MDNQIGERIRAKRKELRITQTQIYNKTGISSGNLSGIEAGKSLPSASALIGLSQVLDCSIDWILTGSSPKSEILTLSVTEDTLLTGFRKLPDQEKDELLDILEIKLRKIKREKSSLSNDEKLA